jgi:hypothetical protein
VQTFYLTDFLDICNRLIGTMERLADQNEKLSNWPDPSRPLEEHSNAARQLAYQFIKTQQLVRAIRCARTDRSWGGRRYVCVHVAHSAHAS